MLCDTSFFAAFNSQIVPTQLALLDHIAVCHELLLSNVFAVVKSMFDVPYAIDPLLIIDVRRMLIDRLILLLSLGHALPVMEFMHQRILSNDTSLTVHFITQILPICGAPYSIHLVEAFLKILSAGDILASLKKKGAAMVDAINFLCRDMQETPSLSPDLRERIEKITERMRA